MRGAGGEEEGAMANDRNWERIILAHDIYDPDNLRVGLQSKGTITLGIGAMTSLKKPGYVELLYERSHKMVGIRAADAQTPGAFRVRKETASSTWSIAARSFCVAAKIPLGKAQRFTGAMEGDVLAFHLDKGIPARIQRAPKGSNGAAASAEAGLVDENETSHEHVVVGS